MKNCYLCLCFLFCLSVNAQSSVVDSLKTVLNNYTKKDTIRVNKLLTLSNELYKQEPEKALIYVEEAAALSKHLNYIQGEAKSFLVKGRALNITTNYDSGIGYYEKALVIYQDANNTNGEAECYKSIGRFYYKNGDQEKALKYYNESLIRFKKIKDSSNIFLLLPDMGWSLIQNGDYDEAIPIYNESLLYKHTAETNVMLPYVYNDLGVAYSLKTNYPLALENFKKSIAISEASGNNEALVNAYGNMAPIYSDLEQYDKAIDYYEKTIAYFEGKNEQAVASCISNIGLIYQDTKQFAKAELQYKEAIKRYGSIRNTAGMAFATNNLGNTYLSTQQYAKAFECFDKAKELCLEVNSQLGLSTSYLGLSKYYTHHKDYSKALQNGKLALETSKKIGALDIQRDAQKLLTSIYTQTKNYKKALSYFKKYTAISDSIFNKENVQKITALEYEYKYQRQLDSASFRESQLKKTVQTTTQSLEKSQDNLLLGVIGFLAVILLLGAIIFTQRLRNIKAKNKNILVEQKLLRTQMTPHFIFNALSVLQGMILSKEHKKTLQYLSKFSKLLRITLENSRGQQVALDQELLALENYVELQNIEAAQPFEYLVELDQSIDCESLMIPPMLIQPFVENAIEHAFVKNASNSSKKIVLNLTLKDQLLECIITDNGVGVNVQNTAKLRPDKKSLSTTITSERLEILSKQNKSKGSIFIEDRSTFKEKGTKVTLRIPYYKN